MKKALICMLQLHKNSGSARTAFENIKYFKSRGYQVHVMSMTMDREMLNKEEVILHKALPWFKSTGLARRNWYNWQVQRLRAKLKPDITVGHGDIQDQDVVTLHNCVFLASELIHGKPLLASHEMAVTHGNILKNKSFKKMIANSELMKNDTIKRFAVPADKIQVIYPALNTEVFFTQKPEEKLKLRQRFGFGEKLVVSLVTSGNFKKRGVDVFIKAIQLLPEDIHKKVSFRVLGKDDSGQFKSPWLNFDPGLSDIQNYYTAIDIFVLPARIEEFGRVVLEAMGCGLPVITTDKVGASELLESDSKKFVIPSEDPQALANALLELINDSSLRQRIGKLNAELAQKQSEDKVMAKFDRVFLDK